MNAIEDRLRAATRAAAGTVPPGSAPPLRLPARRPSGPPGLRSRLRQVNGRRVLAPVAAAAAVAAVVAASLVVTRGGFGPGTGRASGGPATRAVPSTPGPRTPGPAPGVNPPPGPAARMVLAGVPSYYVALTVFSGEQRHAAIRATVTGTVLGAVTPPWGYGTFTWVSAAADDRTFALAAQPWRDTGGGVDSSSEPTKFFLLHLNSSGHPASLTALPIPAEPSSAWVDGIALSPDGSRLAVAVDQATPGVNPKIELFSVATGTRKEWEWPGSGWIGNNKPIGSPLSWAADSETLAFQINPADRAVEVRLLDTATPGGSLNSSALAVEWTAGEVIGPRGVVINGSRVDPGNSLTGMNALITPDGTTIVCVTTSHRSADGVATEFSVSTGALVRVLAAPGTAASAAGTDPSPGTAAQDVLWASTTGTTLIVLTGTGAGVLSGNGFTPVPGTSVRTGRAVW